MENRSNFHTAACDYRRIFVSWRESMIKPHLFKYDVATTGLTKSICAKMLTVWLSDFCYLKNSNYKKKG